MLILKGKPYPKAAELYEYRGRHFLCHPGGSVECDPSTVTDAPGHLADEPPASGGAVDAVKAEARSLVDDDEATGVRHAEIAACFDLARGRVKDTKAAYAVADRTACLGVPNDLPAARYKRELQEAAADKLRKLALL
tara:strand:+ start:757 stop:1167 length:411 start_codon:yes stop_codon:yes gene_type:complete